MIRQSPAKQLMTWVRRHAAGRDTVARRRTPRRFKATAGLLAVSALALVAAQIVLAAPPVVTVGHSPTFPTPGTPVGFTADVSDEMGDTHTFAWQFGDGGTSTAQNPTHSYSTAGTKTVTLTVTDSEATPNSVTVTHQVVVNAPPNASFGFTPNNPNPNQPITFTSNSSDPGGGAVSHAWDFDNDGQFDDGSDAMEQWSFATGGSKTVRLRVTDAHGATDDASATVQVFNNSPPVANFNFAGTNPVTPNVPDVNETVNFVSTSTDPNGNGTIVRTDWDLDGNGQFNDGSGTTVSRSFPTAGNKTIGVRVEDSSGASHSVTKTVRVNALPTAAINILNQQLESGQKRTQPRAGQPFVFTSGAVPQLTNSAPAPGCPAPAATPASAGSSDPGAPTDPGGGTISTFEWDLDNNGTYELTGANVLSPAAGYPAGERTVGLRVTDSDGARATTTLSFRVNAPPAPNFIVEPITSVINEEVTFSSISSDPDAVDSASALIYSWDLDDDNRFCEPGETGLSPKHKFLTANTNPGHRVRLLVTDTGGLTRPLTSPFERYVIVHNTAPNAGINFGPSAPLPGQAVTFTGSASSPTNKPISSMQWDFDFPSGGPFVADASGASVSHAYGSAGPKTVALRVEEVGGGVRIVQTTVVVNAPPQAGFRVAPDSPFVGEPATISSSAVDPDGSIAAQHWDLDGDGAFDDASGPLVFATYASPGPRTVSLRVTDARGATAVASGVLTVRSRPLAFLGGVTIDMNGSLRGKITRVKLLRVRAPAGTTVVVSCKGKGCPKKKKVIKQGKGPALRFKKFERAFKPGTKIVITVTKPGFLGRHTTYTMRRGAGPKRVDLCLAPGAKKPTACPVP
jgi:large repetitive protein